MFKNDLQDLKIGSYINVLLQELHVTLEKNQEHPLYGAATEIYDFIEKHLKQLEEEVTKNPQLPILDNLLIPSSPELKKAKYEVFASMRERDWHLPNLRANKVSEIVESGLIQDLNRGVCVSEENYENSPEFLTQSEKRGGDIAAKQAFLLRTLGIAFVKPNEGWEFHKNWTQELYGYVKDKLSALSVGLSQELHVSRALRRDVQMKMQADVTPNISYDANGNIVLDVVCSNFIAIQWSGHAKDDVSKHLPGTVLTRFVYTPGGWEFVFIKPSNPEIASLLFVEIPFNPKFLDKLCKAITSDTMFPEMAKFEENSLIMAFSKISAIAPYEEYQNLQALLEAKTSKNLMQAISEMIPLVLQEPFNQAVLLNFFGLCNHIEDKEAREQIKQLMVKIVDRVQAIAAPDLLQKLLPKFLIYMNAFLTADKENYLSTLIGLDGMYQQIKHLPAPWNELVKKFGDCLQIPREALQYHLKIINSESDNSFMSYLTQPYIYSLYIVPNLTNHASASDKLIHFFDGMPLPPQSSRIAQRVVDELKTFGSLDSANNNVDEQKLNQLMDAAIYIAMNDLTGKGQLHPILEDIISKHVSKDIASIEATSKLIQSYINNFLLVKLNPQQRPFVQKLLEKRLESHFSEKNFMQDFAKHLKTDLLFKKKPQKKLKAFQVEMFGRGREEIEAQHVEEDKNTEKKGSKIPGMTQTDKKEETEHQVGGKRPGMTPANKKE